MFSMPRLVFSEKYGIRNTEYLILSLHVVAGGTGESGEAISADPA